MPALGSDKTTGLLNVRKGDRIQGVPNFNARLGFEYRFPVLAAGNASAVVRASGQWTGSSNGSFVTASSDHIRPGYFTADASAGLSLEQWDFSLFVRNLANNRQVIQQPSIQGVDTAYYLRPRTVGLGVNRVF